MRHGRTRLALATVALTTLAALALAPGSAFAERPFGTSVPQFFPGLENIAINQTNNNVWITDEGEETKEQSGENGLYEYGPYPSQTRLEMPNTSGAVFGIERIQVAVDESHGELVVGDSNPRKVDFYDETSEGKHVFTHTWTGINSAISCFSCIPDIHTAVDNSQLSSRGRIYLSLPSPEDDVEAYDAAERPVDFPARASYLDHNKITGTPHGPFGLVEQIEVDDEGNIFVYDAGKNVIDEFDYTGTFIQSYPGSKDFAIDPTNSDVLTGGEEYDSTGNFIEDLPTGTPEAVNSEGYLYDAGVNIYKPSTIVATVAYRDPAEPSATGGTLEAQVDPNGGPSITACTFEYGEAAGSYKLGSQPCESNASLPFASSATVSAEISSLTPEQTYHYRVALTTGSGTKYGTDQTYTPHDVVGLTTEAPSDLTESGATLNASLVGDGSATTYYFEWGRTSTYGGTTAAPPGAPAGSPSGPASTPLSATLAGLKPYTTYHYRVVAKNGAGTSLGADREFTTPAGVPTGRAPSATAVHSDRAVLHAEFNPNGGDATVQFEYVDSVDYQSNGWTTARKTAPVEVGRSKEYRTASALISGLMPDTLYRYRAIGTNSAGSGDTGVTARFRTFEFTPSFVDPCPNAHVRQQTGAAQLLDCRAYEIVSDSHAGGYDVESDLVPSQTPFGGYPEARSASGEPEVLYGIHNGGIPGTGNPTNLGVDPYIATRGAEGWTTSYVGIPANDPFASGPFASSLLEADSNLQTFAFGGPEICSPCFADHSTGIPVHTPSGELVQGLAGSIPQPGAEPAGLIDKHLSADGTHLVFGTTSKLEPDGEEGGISIYDRDLATEVTRVVSKTPAGANIACLLDCTTDGIGELDVSSDGSRIVVGQLVSASGGERRWHLYMDVGDSGQTVDLTQGAEHGALFDGMTADGSTVFFTTTDALTSEDRDTSADLYSAEVNGSGVTLSLISKGEGSVSPGEPGNSDSCHPYANTAREHWNVNGSAQNCGIVAVGGAGGVASESGAAYFLSPEQLDTSNPKSQPVPDAPNLYVARPGSALRFVATLESSGNAPIPAPAHPLLRSIGHFEKPTGTAVDRSDGDVYVLDATGLEGSGFVQKFDATGHPIVSFANHGVLVVPGVYGTYNLPTEMAVDQSNGDFYVPDLIDGKVQKFDSQGGHIATVSVPSPSGVAVNQANGDLYVTSYGTSQLYVFDPGGGAVTSFPTTVQPTGVAVATDGTSYVVNGGGEANAKGSTDVYGPAGNHLARFDSNPSYGVAVDPTDGHVYVDEGNRVTEFEPSGDVLGEIGVGLLGSSIGMTADSGTLAISNPGTANVALYGPRAVPVDSSTDNPLVVDSVTEPETRRTGDFEVSPSGEYAAFTSTLPHGRYDNAGHREVLRFDASTGHVECASCNQTSEQATADSSLPIDGLGLMADGRVFFNTTEGLVDRDLNEVEDAYEWEPAGFEFGHGVGPCEVAAGCVQLISTGASKSPSSLLSVSAEGSDAYFFTRDTLAEQDENGSTVKLYDARELGGFAFSPAAIQCKASDECHGAGTRVPSPPAINTVTGSGGNAPQHPKSCKKGFAKQHGRCVKKHRHHHRRAAHRGGRRTHG